MAEHWRRSRGQKLPQILKPLKNSWTVHRSRMIRDIYRDGRLHARFGHERYDCPHTGNVPWLKGQGQWRPDRNPHIASKTLRRRAWLAGWDDETALMKKAAEQQARRLVIDEDDV